MNKSVIVYGPQGCGKTLLAKELATHFGVSKIQDEYTGQPLKTTDLTDTLFLAHERPSWSTDLDRRVVDFFDVLRPAGLLYDARLIFRDTTDGTFFHPHLPAWPDPDDDGRDITPLVAKQGYAIATVLPDDEIDALADDYAEKLKAWSPAAPDDRADWRLAAIADTEDGPQAWFVRPLNPVNQTDQE
jgi:hypothetical protein